MAEACLLMPSVYSLVASVNSVNLCVYSLVIKLLIHVSRRCCISCDSKEQYTPMFWLLNCMHADCFLCYYVVFVVI